jgi:Cu/Ag efflux protein CusF
MIKRVTMLVSLLLVVAVLTGPAFALSVPGMKHHETGNVTAIDKAAGTFTITGDKDQKPYTFQVKDPSMLNTLRTGEHVRVSYSKKGAQLIASGVSERTSKTAARR